MVWGTYLFRRVLGLRVWSLEHSGCVGSAAAPPLDGSRSPLLDWSMYPNNDPKGPMTQIEGMYPKPELRSLI